MKRLELVRQAPGSAGRQFLRSRIGRIVALASSVALFVGIYALRVADPNVADAPLILLVVPIALCAIFFGLRGGLIAASAAIALSVGWHFAGDHDISAIGYVSRYAAYVLVGALVGRFADELRALTRAIGRHQELSLDGIATANFEGYFTTVNPAWTRILGYSQEELLSRPFVDFVHPDDVARTIEEAGKIAGGADAIHFLNRYRTKDGSYRWLSWLATAAPDEQLIYAVARDVTEIRQAEEELERRKEILECAVRERTHELEEARIEVLQRLALAAEYRDDDTHQHTERVGRTAALLAKRLGLAREQVALLRQAAPLHDVGKLGISDTILLKPGKLTAAEFEVVKTHTLIGAKIVSGSRSDILRLAEEIILTHHERWDGNGYPSGLGADQIPLPGRIVAVADVFDALTHNRPYKKAWPIAKALEEIRRQAGSQFDPEIVEAFEQLSHTELLAPTASRFATAA